MLRFCFGYAGLSFGSEGPLTRTIFRQFRICFGSASVILRLSFGYAGLLQVSEKRVLELVPKGLQTYVVSLQLLSELLYEVYLSMRRPHGPSVLRGPNEDFSFGSASVLLRFRGSAVLETLWAPGRAGSRGGWRACAHPKEWLTRPR